MGSLAPGTAWQPQDCVFEHWRGSGVGSISITIIVINIIDQVWAADSEGGVWLRLGSLSPPPTHAAPAWIQVDGEVGAVVQVASSPSGDRVWARDVAGGLWAREAVYPELPCGAAWVEVPGVQAAWIEVSKSSGKRKANVKICPNSPPSVGLGYFWPFVSADWPQ